MLRFENSTLSPDQRVTSRHFNNASTPPPLRAPRKPNTRSNTACIPKAPSRTRPLPTAQVEVVIPPYRPKRKLATPSAIEDSPSPNAVENTLDLSKFAYAPPKTPLRQKVVGVPVAPQGPPTVSRFFASNPTRVQRPVTPTQPHHLPNPNSSGADLEPSAPTKKAPRKRKASLSVPTDLNNEKKAKLDECSCQTLDEHLEAAKPKLIQALVADNPWKLIIAVGLLNKTRGAVSLPIFWEIMEKWPTPEDLAMATHDDLSQVMAKLGFQNTRAKRFIQLSLHYITDPPNADRLHRSRCPSLTPKKRTPKTNVSHNATTEHSPRSKGGKRKKAVNPQAGEGADDPVELPVRYPPTPISHLPGVGRYALDSYRIFSPALSGGGAPRDEQRCLRNLLSPCEDSSEAKPEWKEVRPEDKELRKYLIWRWALEGVRWEPGKGSSGTVKLSDLWNLPHWS